jgi:general secretion pathway protein B
MSYILEALKKAEQQRELGRVPGIASDHDAKSAAGRWNWMWVLVLVLLVNSAVLVALLWPDRGAQKPAETAPETGPLRPATPRVIAEPPETPQPVLRQATLPEDEPESEYVPEAPVENETIARQQERSDPVTPAQPSMLPVWPQIPGHLFEQLNGGLHLDVHVFSEQPRSRFVLINLRKYHEGDDLQEGPVLDEITQEGVILSFRGQRFRVQRQ